MTTIAPYIRYCLELYEKDFGAAHKEAMFKVIKAIIKNGWEGLDEETKNKIMVMLLTDE